MKGEKKVIDHLNTILINELTAINQYFLHFRMLESWGLDKIADHVRGESIDEMKHADRLIERLLFLEGSPNVQRLRKVVIGKTVAEILEADLGLERIAIPDLRAAVADCEKVKDYVSRDLLRGILDEEEEHVDWLETQLELIAKVGLENYLQSQM